MAATPTELFRGAATTTLSTTLYTVPASTTAVVTNIVLTNTDSASHTVTIDLDGTVIVPALTVAANAVVTIDLKQVLAAGKIIHGGASSALVNFHISGVQVT